MKEKIEEIFASNKSFEEKFKEADQLLDEAISGMSDRQKELLRARAEENYVADPASIYDFMTEEDSERNPIP